jgi:multiple sugar transport system ATP-binding protein
MARVRLEDVRKRYGRAGPEVVRGVTLEIADAAFVTLVGPSGCGKSTVLNLIAGLEEVTSGRILFDDDDVTARGPRERDIAMVFQSYALYPHKDVYGNLAFPLRMAGLERGEIDRRVREAAARLGIEGLLDRKPRDLSGGQRQRVALGRALVRKPRVFLLDEPLSNLDAALRVQMRAELKKLHADLGVTFVYVTHDQAEAMTLSDRVVVFNEGVVQQYAPPREVYDRPANVFVARFLGSPPINLLEREGVLEGARPEDTRVFAGADLAGAPAGALRGRIYVVEPMGPETFVTVDVEGGRRVIARAAPDFGAREGDPAAVAFDPAKLHRYSAATGAAATAAGASSSSRPT